MKQPVAILGAGPAGLGAALSLAQRGFPVTVFERNNAVGGNAGSFELAGLRVDYGSHRLHPASDPEVLELIRGLVGDDLLTRPRHGRIRLMGRWLHFPLRAGDLALRVHPRFAVGVALDLARKILPSAPDDQGTFASILERGLGRTICQEFYFPYARKIWGMEPEAISAAQAEKRVSSGSIGKMLKRLVPGGSGSGSSQPKGVFYYPRRGFGQISESLLEAARAAGAEILLEAELKQIAPKATGAGIEFEHDGHLRSMEARHVWSTIPVTALVGLLDPKAPEPVCKAARSLRFRSMLLVYLVLPQDQFTPYDAHYFPGADLHITRLSEPKNYAAVSEPAGRTVLCAELPCQMDDDVWAMSDEALGDLVRDDLGRAGLPRPERLEGVAVRRLPHAYPLYPTGYQTHFDAIDEWLEGIPGLLSFGRQGLFAHDNTHHALYMALAASRCLGDDGSLDQAAWAAERRIFATHVVED
ncbi:MAG: FAD-dependent oxidoreductase [Deltaproteobacteria bacterium]|nr:FAD-dependent oxidoreductase [Deltaproteobacteria bacterium]MBW2394068.1 FAD-dependent oxidoreductase [Deltaproteobacteria bacterium]